MGGEDLVNVAAFYQIVYQATYNSSSPNVVAMWKGIYALVNEANVCIAGFKGAATTHIITDSTANQYIAECRFLRAMAIHEALIHFARPYSDGSGQGVGVPWRDSAIASAAAINEIYNQPRMRTDSVYANILADLAYAEANLPATNFVYRATQTAAIALEMRVRLHMGDFAGVITAGNKIISGTAPAFSSPIGGFTLDASPDGPFILGQYSTKESIFSIKNDALDNPGVNASISGIFMPSDHKGRGLIVISPVIWNNPNWLCDDKRRTLTAIQGGDANGSKGIFVYKYRDSAGIGDYAPQIRYAEVLLTMAEAEARSGAGVSSTAVDLLNAVRNRSLGNPATEAYTAGGFAAQTDLVNAILFERRIEFLAEGKRKGDLSRLGPDPTYSPGGIPAKAVNASVGLAPYNCGGGYTPGQAAIPYSDPRFIWPIPLTETQTNPIVAQNPSY
jgi:hypothetical protein